jgi:HAD superfamily hydrolase (TIGR01484 family)
MRNNSSEKMRSISDMPASLARSIRFVLMDIDDTLTTEGKLPADSYAALWALKEAGLRVIPITGRPAGWCDLIAREWPVDGVVGENGAFVFWEAEGKRLRTLTHPNAVRNDAPALARALTRAMDEVPGCRPARDQFARLYDIAIDFAEEEPVLPLSDAIKIKAICDEEGLRAKVSSIHVNAWMGDYDKLSMATSYLAMRFGYDDARDRDSVVFVGDSPNDEPMFAHFPAACGVANVVRYKDLIRNRPAYVATKECGAGFAEIAKVLLEKRQAGE